MPCIMWELDVLQWFDSVHGPVLDPLMVGITYSATSGLVWFVLGFLMTCSRRWRRCGVSVIVSVEPHGFDSDQGEIMANAIAVFDKFTPIGWNLNERILADFQLIDYTLLAGAINFDAAAGISNQSTRRE